MLHMYVSPFHLLRCEILIAAQLDGENPYFAVKELNHRDGGVDGFKDEVNAWKKSVGNTKHPHLISLLAVWHQDNSNFLLFPWANGNLREFWANNAQPDNDPSLVRWMARQCLGLVEALRKIHRSDSDPSFEYGIHSDIKPENILWFKNHGSEHGTLVICDFGFTKFHDRASRSVAQPVGWSLSYRAPEIDTIGQISRAYDVWTIGCLYLEFTTWYLAGLEGVGCFEIKRVRCDKLKGDNIIKTDKFFNHAGRDGAVVKDAVFKVSLEDLEQE